MIVEITYLEEGAEALVVLVPLAIILVVMVVLEKTIH